MVVPKYDDMFEALIRALNELGGSASISEMEDRVAEILDLSEEDISEIHTGNRTSFSYRLAWTRTYLKNFGAIENSARGIWTLTKKGLDIKEIDKDTINNYVKKLKFGETSVKEQIGIIDEDKEFTNKMIERLLKLSPSSFERLCQRVLRECGFVEVRVTGKTGDGGIDGDGIYKLGNLISLHVIFQCKRYKGNVSSQEIRNFRGSMSGRTNHGLFITTGKFTSDARKEANREGVVPIDLIDGELLVEKLKELSLGVINIEIPSIDEDFFEDFD